MPPRKRKLLLELLEDRSVLAAGFGEFADPHATAGNQFGSAVVPLATGNVVVTSPYDDAGGTDAGAVYLFNGRTGELISTLTGSHADDHVGSLGVTALANGNFVIDSPDWDSDTAQDVGAVTWGDGMRGIEGVVGQTNSLVGSTASDQVGAALSSDNEKLLSGVTALPNGNFVVESVFWHNAGEDGAGASTFVSGVIGIHGEVNEDNSLVGTMQDGIGGGGTTVLSNGNYVILSPGWQVSMNSPFGQTFIISPGAATFADGTTGIVGEVSASNSLVGTFDTDMSSAQVTALANGNYVVGNPTWGDEDEGAATWGSGTNGVSGPISAANSLVGTNSDEVGAVVTALPNGNYVVFSPEWNDPTFTAVGAMTWASGATGLTGTIDATNSLVGSSQDDLAYSTVTVLTNGNYVIDDPLWNDGSTPDVGAVIFGSGTSGVHGVISSAISLVGSVENDKVGSGGVTPLANGNYVVSTPEWNNYGGKVPALGAVTWGDGTLGISGVVNYKNSLIGLTIGDSIGSGGVAALTNGNYVVGSPGWSEPASGSILHQGAATWADGTKGLSGYANHSNSLVGGTPGDFVGSSVVPLANGNYVVASPYWHNGTIANAGAATFGSGMSGVSGAVNLANSLVGSTGGDQVSEAGITALANGNYVVSSPNWDDSDANIVNAGAATWCDGATGTDDAVSPANSLVGSSTSDNLGLDVTTLSNGNYVVVSRIWDNGLLQDAGAATFGSGVSGIAGLISASNSAIGSGSNSSLHPLVLDNVNQAFYVRFLNDGGGRVVVGSQIDGFAHHWHLAASPLDVNNDAHVAPNDVLDIINYINSGSPTKVAADGQVGKPFGFLDVTGDDFVAADDALAVINAINAGQGGEGEQDVQHPMSKVQCQATGDSSADAALMMWLGTDMNGQAGRRRIF